MNDLEWAKHEPLTGVVGGSVQTIRYTGKKLYEVRGLRGAGAKNKRRLKKYQQRLDRLLDARKMVRAVYDGMYATLRADGT